MASTNLQRTYADGGNHQIGTHSFWLKRSRISTDDEMILRMTNGSHYFQFKFDSSDILNIQDYQGSFIMYMRLSKEFRDVNAWYHIVIRIDTTQATEADRVRVYVNGELQTAFEQVYNGSSWVNTIYPSQNANLYLGEQQTFYIGSTSSANYYDGLMSHFHYCDGYSYDASSFGSTDATTGIWKINTSPSVSYGTNGFFILKDGNGVTDQSGQSNDWAVGGGTLSATKDCPSNVYATTNPLVQLDLGNGTFSATNGNNKFTTNYTSKSLAGYSTLGATKGKYYAECKYISGNHAIFGVVREDFMQTGSSFAISNADWGIEKGTTAYYGGSSNGSWHGDWSPNDILGCALDLDTGTGRVTFSKNGQWCDGSGNWDESSPTSWFTLTADKTYFFAAGDNSTSTNAAWEFNFGNGLFGSTAVSSAQNPGTGDTGAIFEYTVPSGFTALSTKGMNSF